MPPELEALFEKHPRDWYLDPCKAPGHRDAASILDANGDYVCETSYRVEALGILALANAHHPVERDRRYDASPSGHRPRVWIVLDMHAKVDRALRGEFHEPKAEQHACDFAARLNEEQFIDRRDYLAQTESAIAKRNAESAQPEQDVPERPWTLDRIQGNWHLHDDPGRRIMLAVISDDEEPALSLAVRAYNAQPKNERVWAKARHLAAIVTIPDQWTSPSALEAATDLLNELEKTDED